MNNLIFSSVLLVALLSFIVTSPIHGDSHTDFNKSDLNVFPGQQNFFVSLWQTLRKINPKKIDLFSPHSIYQALLLAYIGAGGETERSLRKLLHLDYSKSKNEIIESFQFAKLVQHQRLEDKHLEFSSVNKFYVTDNATLTDMMKTKFVDSVEKSNFTKDPNGVRRRINDFVEEVTKGMIRDLVPEDLISDLTTLVITNAVYFKGKWEYEFDAKQTEKKNFNGESPREVEMMKLQSKLYFGHINELDTTFIKLPYVSEDGAFSMFVLLPNTNSSSAVDNMLDRLILDQIEKLSTGGSERDVIVEFPKFEMEYELTSTTLSQVSGV